MEISWESWVNVVQEAYVRGISTRKVDELVQALGMECIDKSKVSRISQELDGHVGNMALVIAVGVNENGEREILGVPRKQQGMVSAIVRTVFAVPEQKTAKNQLYTVVNEKNYKQVWKTYWQASWCHWRGIYWSYGFNDGLWRKNIWRLWQFFDLSWWKLLWSDK